MRIGRARSENRRTTYNKRSTGELARTPFIYPNSLPKQRIWIAVKTAYLLLRQSCLLLDVNVHLGEGYLDSVCIELVVDGLKHTEVYRPIVRAVYPYAKNEIDRACTVLLECNEGSGILEHQLVFNSKLHKKSLDLVYVGAVSGRECEIHTAKILLRIVGYVAV